MTPVSPIKTIDTKKVASAKFGFCSNKLNELGRQLGLGVKEQTGGYKLWIDCKAGVPKAWLKMKSYNKQDVVLLEQIYLRLRPWMTNHPNRNLFDGTLSNCPTCGSSRLQSRGYGRTISAIYHKYQCQNCGSWPKGAPIKSEKVLVRP
jgi:hypothetical protein